MKEHTKIVIGLTIALVAIASYVLYRNTREARPPDNESGLTSETVDRYYTVPANAEVQPINQKTVDQYYTVPSQN